MNSGGWHRVTFRVARAALKTTVAVKIDRGGGSQLKTPCCTGHEVSARALNICNFG